MDIETNWYELNELSNFLKDELLRNVAADEFIPLPHLEKEEQLERINEQHELRDERYWHIDGEHNHGWCCGYCGTVVQWG